MMKMTMKKSMKILKIRIWNLEKIKVIIITTLKLLKEKNLKLVQIKSPLYSLNLWSNIWFLYNF